MSGFTEGIVNASGPIDATEVFGPQRDSVYIVLPITIVYSLIFITGLTGNIFTCMVIVRNKSMHTATNYYLFSLAISDLLLLVSGMPQEMYSIWCKWPYAFGHTFCVIRGLASETSTNASVLTITLFTIERYLAICHPFVSHTMSKLSRAVKHVFLLWVVSLGLALPQALQFGIKVQKGVEMCLQTRVIIEHSFEISTFLFFFAPMILITVLYFLMGLKLRETTKNNKENEKEFERNMRHSHKMRRKHSQSTRRVVKMLVAVVVAFFICWAPFHAQRLVAIYGTTENHLAKSPILFSVYSFLTYISGVFYYMSTCINPIFYHIMSNKFRDAFKNTMFSWCWRSNDRSAGKKCSYTAMPFTRNPTSSGNSIKNENDSTNKTRRQNSRESNLTQTFNVYQNGKTTVTTTTNAILNHDIKSYVNKPTLQSDFIDEITQIQTEITMERDNSNNNTTPNPVYCIEENALHSSPTPIPEAVISLEDEINYVKTKSEKNIKETKLKILPVDIEYG